MDEKRIMETVSCLEVAKSLKLAPRRVSALIEKGILPIGFVDTSGKRRRTIIIRRAFEKFISGD